MQPFTQKIKEFFNKHQNNIYSAAIFIFIVNALFALFFIPQFMQTGVCRDYMVFGSPSQSCSLTEFLKHGFLWMTFVDAFIILPGLAWSMIMPGIVNMAHTANQEE